MRNISVVEKDYGMPRRLLLSFIVSSDFLLLKIPILDISFFNNNMYC